MKSSASKMMRRPDTPTAPVLVAEGGVPYTAIPDGDPIEAWLDLMEAVEALCPEWPAPESKIWCDYRL